MSKKNNENNKSIKKNNHSAVKNNPSAQKDKEKNETVNIHYPSPAQSSNLDKNLIIVLLCFALILFIVVIEKKFYKQNESKAVLASQTAETHETDSESAVQSDIQPKNQVEAENIDQKKQSELYAQNAVKSSDKEKVVIAGQEDARAISAQKPIQIETSALPEKDFNEIILDFESNYKFTQDHKLYLSEKLEAAKKTGYSNNVVVYGHVNDAKNEDLNIKESLLIANNVAEYLKSSGYNPVSVRGKGSENLEGLTPVRKVEIQLFQYR